MRAQTANAFAFSSGDKRVDKTKQPEHWAGLEEGLKAVYKQRLGETSVQSLFHIAQIQLVIHRHTHIRHLEIHRFPAGMGELCQL